MDDRLFCQMQNTGTIFLFGRDLNVVETSGEGCEDLNDTRLDSLPVKEASVYGFVQTLYLSPVNCLEPLLSPGSNGLSVPGKRALM